MTIQLLSILLFLNNSTMFVSIIMISLHNCWIIESSRIDMSNNSAIMEILPDTQPSNCTIIEELGMIRCNNPSIIEYRCGNYRINCGFMELLPGIQHNNCTIIEHLVVIRCDNSSIMDYLYGNYRINCGFIAGINTKMFITTLDTFQMIHNCSINQCLDCIDYLTYIPLNGLLNVQTTQYEVSVR